MVTRKSGHFHWRFTETFSISVGLRGGAGKGRETGREWEEKESEYKIC